MKALHKALPLLFTLIIGGHGARAFAESPFQSGKWAHDADRDTVKSYNLAADLYDQTKNDPNIEALWSSLKILGDHLGSGLDPKVHQGSQKAAVRNYLHTVVDADTNALIASANAVLPFHPEFQAQIDELEAWLAFLSECVDSEFGNNRDLP